MSRHRDRRAPLILALAALAISLALACGVATADSHGETCRAGLIVRIGETCTYPGTSDEFTVGSDGKGRFLSFTAGGLLNARNVTVDGRAYNFAARSQGRGRWRILVAGDPAEFSGPGEPSPSPTPTSIPTPVPMPLPEPDDEICRAGLIVRTGETCTYPGTSDEFTVGNDGKGRFLSFTAGGLLNARQVIDNRRLYDFAARSQGLGKWRILKAGSLAELGPCANGIAVRKPGNNLDLVGDCSALLAARDILTGGVALNWSADVAITEWQGVVVWGSPARVRGVDLGLNELNGNIPPQLGSLTNLIDLRVCLQSSARLRMGMKMTGGRPPASLPRRRESTDRGHGFPLSRE